MSQVRRRAMMRERQNLRIGLFAILLSLIALYLAFAGLPFRGGYRVDAIV
jgi:hypothetical protein